MTKSILQLQADKLRELKVSIESFEESEKSLASEVELRELELMKLQSTLNDIRTLLYTERDKINRCASDMHILIEKALNRTQKVPVF